MNLPIDVILNSFDIALGRVGTWQAMGIVVIFTTFYILVYTFYGKKPRLPIFLTVLGAVFSLVVWKLQACVPGLDCGEIGYVQTFAGLVLLAQVVVAAALITSGCYHALRAGWEFVAKPVVRGIRHFAK